jgi:hypothetical protein
VVTTLPAELAEVDDVLVGSPGHLDVNPTPLGVTVTQSASMPPVAAGVGALVGVALVGVALVGVASVGVASAVGPAVGLAVAAIDGAWDTVELPPGHPLP